MCIIFPVYTVLAVAHDVEQRGSGWEEGRLATGLLIVAMPGV